MPSIFSTADFNRNRRRDFRLTDPQFLLAQALRRGIGTGPVKGGLVEGLSRIGQAFIAKNAQDKADAAFEERERGHSNDLAQALKAGQGFTDPDTGKLELPGDPNAMARALIGSSDKGLQDSGVSMLADLLQRKNTLADAATARTNKVTDATTAFERKDAARVDQNNFLFDQAQSKRVADERAAGKTADRAETLKGIAQNQFGTSTEGKMFEIFAQGPSNKDFPIAVAYLSKPRVIQTPNGALKIPASVTPDGKPINQLPQAPPAAPAAKRNPLLGLQVPPSPRAQAAPAVAAQPTQSQLPPASTAPAARNVSNFGPSIIPGTEPPSIAEKDEKKAKRQQNRARAGGTVIQDIGRAIEIVENDFFSSGPPALIAQEIPGTDAFIAKGHIESALSNIGLDTLQAIREGSPTGGGLGQIPIQQQKRLEQVLGSLKLEQGKQEALDNLRRVHNIYMDIVHGTPEEIAELVASGKVTQEKAAPFMDRFELSFDEFGFTKKEVSPTATGAGSGNLSDKFKGQNNEEFINNRSNNPFVTGFGGG